jgi:hypothetical protein
MQSRSHALRLPFWHTLSTRTLFFILSAILITIFGYYVYLVNKTVANVVVRERTEGDIAALSSSIGELEFKYIGLKNSVTLDLAYSKGFAAASPVAFIPSIHSKPLSYNYTQ